MADDIKYKCNLLIDLLVTHIAENTHNTFVSSDRSSYSDSVLLYIQQQQRPLFEILSISANIHSSVMFYDDL